MKQIKIIILGLFLTTSTLTFHFVHFKRYKSYREQVKLYKDLNTSNYGNTSPDFYNNIEVDLPNLTLTTIPLKALKASYIIANEPIDSMNKAIDLLHKSMKENPYLMYAEGSLAQLYFSLKKRDSAYYYSRKSFNGLPNNAIHFAMLSKLFANEAKIDSIIFYYNKLNSKTDKNIAKIFLASMNNFFLDLDFDTKALVTQKTKKIKRDHITDKEIQLLADYILAGKDSINYALDLEKKGEKLLVEKKFQEGIIKYQKALEIRKNNLPYISTIGLAYYNLSEYKKAIENLEIIESNGLELDPVSLYVKGISHLNLGQKNIGCDYLLRSSKYGNESASRDFNRICQDQD